MSASLSKSFADLCVAGGGDAGALMRSIDWTKNPLGPISGWPTTLRTAVGIMLGSRFAMRILWGPEFIFLHNDGYRPILGASKYPGAMGSRTAESFAEVWDVVGPMFDRVMAGESVALDDRILPLERNGYLEECFFTLSYSPLSDDHDGIGGVLGVVYETTERVLAERRLRALRQLAAGVSNARTAEQVCDVAAQTFASANVDVPFALLYLRDEKTARLVARAGLDATPNARPAVVELGGATATDPPTWPLVPPTPSARMWLVDDVRARFGELRGGPYPEAVTSAIVLSLERPDAGAPYGYLVAGVNPRRALDPDYEAFFELAGEHLVAALANTVRLTYTENARRTVEASRAFLEGVVNQMPAGVVIVEAPSGKIVLSNNLADALLGQLVRHPSSLGEPSAYTTIHQDGRLYTPAERPLVRALAGELVLEEEVTFLRPDGSRHILLVSAAPVYDADQRLVAGVSSFVDITERKHTELALRDSEERGRAIVAALEEGIVLRGAEGKIRFLNASAERMLGLSLEEVAARPSADPRIAAIREDGSPLPVDQQAPMRALREGRPLTNEVMGIRHPDGRLLWISVNAQPLFDSSGAISGVVSSLFDITQRRAADEERLALLARAERARQAAESASRSKDEFLAIVSHELRNPLNAMLGWTRMLRAGSLSDDRAARALETIERNATNQAQLIGDLLDVSRVISGKLPLDVQTVTFARLIEAAIDSARPAIEAKGLRLSVVLDTDAVLSGDPGRLQQVVWNLLTNATKFTPRGGSIRVVLRRDDSHLELCVSDTGLGIDPTFLGHVFDRFRQADPSTTRQHGGLGLGLAIAKNLVEMHGGTIEAKSDGLGHGASFLVRVPVAALQRSAPAQPAMRPSEPPRGLEPPEGLSGLRVLVVDDEADAREFVTAVLADCGAVVTTADSVVTAMGAFQAEPPDVVISDIGMPDADGYALVVRIRALARERGGATPAACLTGYTTVDDRRKALLAGFNMHLSKPIEPSELIAVVANLGRMAKALRVGG